ncbi:MAG: M13 family metallopeptidase, partial [Acidobacteria bacterium]|nr:M13 family metallopeptidase [Acidobacteriota bacterium]
IAYPAQWDDYAGLEIKPDDPLGNILRARTYRYRRNLAKIGKPIDKTEWPVPVTATNAYYDSVQNAITVPAALLQPPFFDPKADDGTNLGSLGAVVAHELAHAIDEEGAKYDAEGRRRDWWTAEDYWQFRQRASCFIEQYKRAAAQHGNGLVNAREQDAFLTAGEIIADNIGLKVALLALQAEETTGSSPGAPAAGAINGLTPEQRFFTAFARMWCEAGDRATGGSDVHPPAEYRVKGVLQNFPEFREAFACAQEDKPTANACTMW